MVLPSFEHYFRKCLRVAVIRIWFCIFRSIWDTSSWRWDFIFYNVVSAFMRSNLNVHHILLHLTDSFHLWIFSFGPLILSTFVYQLYFFLKPLGATRNRNNHVILSKAIINEINEVSICSIDLVDLFQRVIVRLHFGQHSLTLQICYIARFKLFVTWFK